MTTKRIEESKIKINQHLEIHQLLKQCFSAYPADRSFYKQFPSFRYLVYSLNTELTVMGKKLVAHLAVIHRMIKVGDKNFSIFGVSDFCVHPDFQKNNVASVLLQELEKLGKKRGIDFIVLVAQEQDFYKKNHYQSHNNTCRWLIINDIQSLGLAQRSLNNALMVKALGDEEWGEGVVDFLGPMF